MDPDLHVLGVDGLSVEALWPLPLIEVAWVDGLVEPPELRRVERAMAAWRIGSEARLLVEDWMRHPPSATYLQRARCAVVRLDAAAMGGPILRVAEGVLHGQGTIQPSLCAATEAIARWRRAFAGDGSGVVFEPHPDLDRAEARPPVGAPAGAWLVPCGVGQPVPLSPGGTSIGSGPDDQARIDDGDVAWSHCRLRRAQGRWYAEDYAARTWVNGERITYRRLLGGEILRLSAGSALWFVWGDQVARKQVA